MAERNRSLLLLIAALVCFVVALLIEVVNSFNHGNFDGWIAGGFVALTLALISEKVG